MLEGRADPAGRVVVVDDLGFHQATSVAELLADRGCEVEIITAGMVVGQDLGITLDMETFNVRAHAKGIRQATDLVVIGAAAGDEETGGGSGGVELALLHHPTGEPARQALRLGGVRGPPGTGRFAVAAVARGAVRGAPDRRLRHPAPGSRRRDRGAPGGGDAMTMPADLAVLAVVVVRDGQLPLGADETVTEAGGAALVVGSGTRAAAGELDSGRRVWLLERSSAAPGALAAALTPVLSGVRMVLLPASPDGRDLAPRLAVAMGRALLAGAVWCAPHEVELTRLDDRLSLRVAVEGPAVVTLRPGRPGGAGGAGPAGRAEVTELPAAEPGTPAAERGTEWDAESVEVLQPEPSTVDLAEARRIVGGGAGLVPAGTDGEAVMRLLADVAGSLGASAGATRVVTDAGWMGYDRQIGTTGVAVSPDLYVAFGISGAAQHVGGLGAPEHVVSVNTDPSCPMTLMADLGIVADAPAVLAVLAGRLGVTGAAAGQPEEASHAG